MRELKGALSRRSCLGRALSALSAAVLPPSEAMAGEAVPSSIQAAVPADVMVDYGRFLNRRDPLTLSDFSGPHSRRDVVEVVLLHQALALGGWAHPLEFVDMPSGERLLREISTGRLVCSATTYWEQDTMGSGQGVMLSRAMVQAGEFEAGLYTVESNRRAMSARSLADVRALSVLSNRNWVVDWATLEQLGIHRRQHVTNWELMPRMVEAGRADLLLAPFQATPDLSLTVGKVRLVPIPGLKISLRGTRHYLLAREHPQGFGLRSALDIGLQRLLQQGVVRKAYTQSGFFNTKTASWARL
ncbi:hypothetical protein [Kinneretia aquatilis]|uniref:hypothetical protein n=1 Tax=Kinneretia aquatilis TaxID=2070761 RepID=UPI001495369B|nr:hypothetical protein [Paucibacter aquatile]WIV97322.1 hypothetical protein K9V56_020245 [Paucibacter aquatile]